QHLNSKSFDNALCNSNVNLREASLIDLNVNFTEKSNNKSSENYKNVQENVDENLCKINYECSNLERLKTYNEARARIFSKIPPECTNKYKRLIGFHGTKQPVIGVVNLLVKYNSIEKTHKFFIVPSLSQELYLGFDFWRCFNIAPELHCLEVSEINFDLDIPKVYPENDQHILNPEQSFRLEKNKNFDLNHDSFSIQRI
uniref:Uncharacterized protein n=1 Tax=Megaselia scalaris TaxID=36166 RepID=T1H473_MEGSC